MGITAWQVVDDAVSAYRAYESAGERGEYAVRAEWVNLTTGMRSAVSRYIGKICPALTTTGLDRLVVFVKRCTYGETVAFLEPTPAAEVAATMERMGLSPVSGGSPAAEFIVKGDKPSQVDGRASTLATLRDGLAKLRGAYRVWPCETTANLIGEYERAVAELETPPAPALPKVPARGGQHAKPATDGGDLIISILGRDYEVCGLPIPSAIGSHAYRMRGRHHGVAYDLCRDLFGSIQCDCGSATFRDGLCKHATALVGAGLMPLPASAPLPPFARRWPDAPRAAADGI